MSLWKSGKTKLKEAASGGRSSSPARTAASGHSRDSSASSTTTAPASGAPAAPKRGLLSIRVLEGRSLPVPALDELPLVLRKAIEAAGGALSAQSQGGQRESLQRKNAWWLPYLVVEFDNNEVQVDALGGRMGEPSWMYKAQFDVSRSSEVTLSCYMRVSPSPSSSDSSADLFLGATKFTPSFSPSSTGSSDEGWFELSPAGGKVHVGVEFKLADAAKPMTLDDFELLKLVGRGSFGKVMQVRKKDTGRIYALKTIRKAHIVSRSEVVHTLAERTVLAQVKCPFIVPLKFSFQSPEKLFIVLSYVNGGELFSHLQREGRFSEERSRFYAAELLIALDHLHSFNVIYRDLKPENILIDYSGHIALCDFGLCKLNMTETETTNTFCGTPEYLAPELLKGDKYTRTVDWWTLGVLIYEMLSGLPPYYSENTSVMYQSILSDPLRFGDEISPDARTLLTGLLTRDPAQRLGANGAQEIQRHPWFAKHIDWNLLVAKKIQPPFKPNVQSGEDTSNFDAEFTNENPVDSVVEDSHLSETVQAQFQGFSYVTPGGGFGPESVR